MYSNGVCIVIIDVQLFWDEKHFSFSPQNNFIRGEVCDGCDDVIRPSLLQLEFICL